MKVKKKQNRDSEAFTDFCMTRIVGFSDSITGDIPINNIIEQYKDGMHHDEGLTLFIEDYLSKFSEIKDIAEATFWNRLNELSESDNPYLTKKQFKTLTEAYAGNIDAIAKLVRAEPRILLLPFIMEGVILFLREYAKEMKTTKKTVKDLQDKWTAFLPSKKLLPYRDEDLTFLYTLAKKAGMNASNAKHLIAESLGISEKTLSKRLRIKGSSGRPKK